MPTISLAECYEYGFRIADLEDLVVKRYEEIYDDPDPQETIRQIARSQDDWSYECLRRYLEKSLIYSHPPRRFNRDLNEVLDDVITTFYYGETMVTATSSAHAKQIQQVQASHDRRLNAVVGEIVTELSGIGYAELPQFLSNVIIPKYGESWSNEDVEVILYRAMKIAAQAPDFVYSLGVNMPALNRSEAVIKHFGEDPMLAVVSDLIEDLAADLKIETPPATPVPAPVPANAMDPIHMKNPLLDTKTLTVTALRREANGIMLQFKKKDGSKTTEFFWQNSSFPRQTDLSQLPQFIGTKPEALPYLITKLTAAL